MFILFISLFFFGLLLLSILIAWTVITYDDNTTAKIEYERRVKYQNEERCLMQEYVKEGEVFFFHKYKLDWFGQSQHIIRLGHLIGIDGMRHLIEKQYNNEKENEIFLDALEEHGPIFS